MASAVLAPRANCGISADRGTGGMHSQIRNASMSGVCSGDVELWLYKCVDLERERASLLLKRTTEKNIKGLIKQQQRPVSKLQG